MNWNDLLRMSINSLRRRKAPYISDGPWCVDRYSFDCSDDLTRTWYAAVSLSGSGTVRRSDQYHCDGIGRR